MKTFDHSLNDLVMPVPGVDPSFPCEHLTALFERHNTTSLVVLRDRKPIGFLSHKRVADLLSTRFGFALYENRPATELMLTEFLSVDVESGFSDIVLWALEREQGSLYEDIVVVRNSEYVGLISIARLLEEQRKRITLHVDELERQQRKLEAMNAQLTQALKDVREKEQQLIQSEKMAAIGILASGIAHDFNNMLSAILSSVHFLKGKLPRDSNLVRYCETIESAADRSAGLTKQLLQFSQKSIVSFKIVSLNALIRETVRILERSIGKEISIELSLDDSIDSIEADEHQIQQVIMNLALNARDAMPRGGVLRMTTNAIDLDEQGCRNHPSLQPGLHMVCTVEDTGEGIAPEHRSKIFEPFFSTKGVGKGTGLGLAVVYGVIQRHQGRIEVESEVGRGTKFTLFFRVPEGRREAEEFDGKNVEVERGHGTILLVDDEQWVLQTHAEYLETLGYRVLQASDGEAAVHIFREQSDEIDLVILDMAMPGKDGRETFDALRSVSSTMPVMFLSGYTDEEKFRAVLSDGARDFVRKPFDRADFSRRVKALVEQQSF